jgi:ABC-type multidrug transport system permease subunit
VEFLAGKILFGASLLLGISAFALVVAAAWVGIEWSRVPLAILWAAVSGVAILALMLVLQLLSPSQRAAEVFTLAITFPLIMIGGSFFPFEAMRGWMVAVGRKTPNGWAVMELKRILFGAIEPASLAAAFAGMLAMAAVLFAISAWRLRAGFARE